MNDFQIITSPEGVKLLIENLWLRHKMGLKQRENNIFMVELPSPTSEEIAAANRPTASDSRLNYDSDELFGAFI